VITMLAGPRAPQALWSAAARRRFHAASLLASRPLGYCLRAQGQRAGPEESGSKLLHSKAGCARKIRSCHTDSQGGGLECGGGAELRSPPAGGGMLVPLSISASRPANCGIIRATGVLRGTFPRHETRAV